MSWRARSTVRTSVVAKGWKDLPAGVRVVPALLRTNRLQPSCSSSAAILALTVDCVTNSREAALRKFPAAMTVRKVRASSVSMGCNPLARDQAWQCRHSPKWIRYHRYLRPIFIVIQMHPGGVASEMTSANGFCRGDQDAFARLRRSTIPAQHRDSADGFPAARWRIDRRCGDGWLSAREGSKPGYAARPAATIPGLAPPGRALCRTVPPGRIFPIKGVTSWLTPILPPVPI
ncbi:hypothetical protein D9M68_240160 [compost metagenome]